MKMADILRLQVEMKHKGEYVYSNYYNKYNDLTEDLDAIICDDAVVFFVSEQYVKRTFFCASDLDSLCRLLEQAPANTVLDYINKGKMPEEVEKSIINGGYKLRDIYSRNSRPIPYTPPEESVDKKYVQMLNKLYNPTLGEHAKPEDFSMIKQVLLENFDPVNSDVFSDEDLKEAINNGWVWIYKVDGQICCMYIYQIIGKKRYGAITYNRLSADYLYSIVKNADDDSEEKYGVKQHYFWVNDSNKKIARTLIKEGKFMPDGIKNYIYYKEEKND